MTAPTRKHVPFANRLLAALPRAQGDRLFTHLDPVSLTAGTVLCEPGDQVQQAYFFNSGLASLLSVTEDGDVIEVGMVGNEGLVGASALPKPGTTALRAVVQLPGEAMAVKAGLLREEFDRGGKLQDLLLRYNHLLLSQLILAGACNRFHTVEQRFCRWLLSARDRVRTDRLHLTQESIAQMLGVSRPSVTLVATRLQKLKLLSCRRREISLLDQPGLEAQACGCYGVIKDELEQFLKL